MSIPAGRRSPALPTFHRLLLGLVAASCALGACFDDYRICEAPGASALAEVPQRLSETGLFADMASQELGPGVRPYEPSFQLWSDGATKRRWVALPEGAVIDTADMDAWRFPVGTKLWKEFARGGVVVETRLLQKAGAADDAWTAVAYVWNQAGEDAVATPNGVRQARGTAHDVPPASACMGCHGGRPSRVLGFSAIQLSHEAADEAWTLSRLDEAGVLSEPAGRSYVVPGDEEERAALGYIHANCGHCHNQERPDSDGPRCFDPDNDLDFWLRTSLLDSAASTTTYKSAVGSVISPGDPDDSKLFDLVSHRGEGEQMPPLATDRVDEHGVAVIRAWIEGM